MFEFKNQKKEEVKNEYKAPEKMLLEPKEVTIKGCKFIISKMPCLAAQEVIIRIGSGIIPLINQYAISEDMVIKMLSCCQRVYEDKPNVPLISKDIINNHIPDFEVLIQLENECLKYNYDFKNIDGFVGQIIASGKATLNELKTVYTLEDALNIFEAEAISKYNEYLIGKASIKE